MTENLPPPYTNCQVVENAVAGASGKDIRGSASNLAQAYAHAKTCQKCSESLGTFLAELIKGLGVRLPNVSKFDPDRQPEYDAAPSNAVSKELGPGTTGWDPKKSAAGYKLKPTLSTLSLTVQSLEEKCKLKDAMIQAMADEFRHLNKCKNWSPADLMSNVAETDLIGSKIDFDRRALCNYLHDKPPHSFFPTPDEEREFKATNPLGLRVSRQVGPDSLLVEWNKPPPGKVHTFELYVNGLYAQRINSSSRTKAILHPVDLSTKVYLTLTAISFTGEVCENASIPYP